MSLNQLELALKNTTTKSRTPVSMYQFNLFLIVSGAIIRDGDRKSWDARGPMIWDNFSIFRTNCAILMTYFRADPHKCLGLSHGCCHVVRVMKW